MASFAFGFMTVCAAPALAQTDFWTCPSGFAGQTLHVYNWTTYIAEDTISNFERLCGVHVQYDTYASDTDMITELERGTRGYDVVVPTDVNVTTMISEDLLQSAQPGANSQFRQHQRPVQKSIVRPK